MKTVMITGANGFVGKALTRRLQQAGYSVWAGARPGADTSALEGLARRVETPDLTDHADWAPVLEGAELVVHLAARNHAAGRAGRGQRAAFLAANAEGTRRVAEGARRAGVRRIVAISSIKAVGEGQPRPYSEASECRPESDYGHSKLAAEHALFDVADADDRLEAVVLRPPLVHGPGAGGSFEQLVRLAAKGRPIPLGRVRARRSMVAIDNLTSAIAACLEHPRAAGEVFHVCDDEALTVAETLKLLARAMNRRLWTPPVPVSWLRLAGALCGRREVVDRLVGPMLVDATRLRDTLGWRPPVSVAEGLALSAEARLAAEAGALAEEFVGREPTQGASTAADRRAA